MKSVRIRQTCILNKIITPILAKNFPGPGNLKIMGENFLKSEKEKTCWVYPEI